MEQSHMAKTKARKKRKRYSSVKRNTVLAAAQKEDLTARQVQRRFGVTPVTYYSWRKKAKLPPMPRGRRPGSGAVKAGPPAAAPKMTAAVEHDLRGQVRRRVTAIVQDEIRRALAEIK
jgi:transposase-like protein